MSSRAIAIGLVLGASCIAASLYAWLIAERSDGGVYFFGLLGLALVGLALWQRVSFSAPGGFKAEFEVKDTPRLEVETRARKDYALLSDRDPKGVTPNVTQAALRLEELALEKLTRPFGIDARRNVTIAGALQADGLILNESGSDTIIEVKWVRDTKGLSRVAPLISRFGELQEDYRSATGREATFQLVLVVPDELGVRASAFEPLMEKMSTMPGDWGLQWFSYDDLGIDPPAV